MTTNNFNPWKLLCFIFLALAVVHYVLMHLALSERDEARKATREEAIAYLCKEAGHDNQ